MKYILVNDKEEKFLHLVAEEREMVSSFPFTFVIGERSKLLWAGNPGAGLTKFIHDYFSQ